MVKMFDLPISDLSLEKTVRWVEKNNGTVYCCGLNDVVNADEDKNFKKILQKGDVLTADGMPLVWMMKLKTGKGERVYGPDLLGKFTIYNLQFTNKQVFIGDEKNRKFFEKFGKYIVLPYKDKFYEDDFKMLVKKINNSTAHIVWIGLGAKKQIIVADELKKRLAGRVYITVGAAFDFLSGNKRQAPKWMQKNGLEWLFRMVSEPKRLGKRYLAIGFFLIRYGANRLFHSVGAR